MTFLESSTAWSLQILVIGACAEACAPLLRRSHPRVRANFWLGALVLSLASPWLMSGMPPPPATADGGILVVSSVAVGRALSGLAPSWETAIGGLWALVALGRLGWLGRGLYRLSSITRGARPIAIDGSPTLRVRETSAIRSPASSFIGRVILVPPTFHALPATWREAAIAHETIHLTSGHGVLLLIEEAVLSLFWFHPGVFRLVRRVRDSREEMVDACTIASVGNPRDYRDMLIGLAARMTIPAPAVSGTSSLSARIESLITLEEHPMLSTSKPRLLMTGLAMLSAAGFASAAAPIGRSSEGIATDGAQAAAKPVRQALSKVNPVYPAALKEKKISGVVVLTVVVDEDGRVTEVSARPADNPEFATAAMDAVRQWRFEPGEGSATMTHTVAFRLDGEDTKSVSAVTKLPRAIVSKVEPVYPAAMKEKRVSGVVILSVTVDRNGVVTDVEARPEDNPDLAKAAMEAVRQWRFESGEGRVRMTLTVAFKLK